MQPHGSRQCINTTLTTRRFSRGAWKWKWKCQSLSRVWLFVTPGAIAHQAPLSMIFSRQEVEWVAISSSKGPSWSRDWTQVSCTAGRFFTVWATQRGGWGGGQKGHKSLLYLTKIPWKTWMCQVRAACWRCNGGEEEDCTLVAELTGQRGRKATGGRETRARWCYRSRGGTNLVGWAGSVTKAFWRKQPLGKASSWVSWVRVERKGKVVISVEGTAQQGGERVSKGEMFSCLQTSAMGYRFPRSACYYVPPKTHMVKS